MIRVVVDSNVYLSSYLSKNLSSTIGKVVSFAFSQATLLYDDALFAEIRRTFGKKKFVKYGLANRAPILINLIEDSLQTVYVRTTAEIEECRDPDDDYLLALALDGEADYIVTGDSDLLVLDPWRGIRIVRPATFLELVAAES